MDTKSKVTAAEIMKRPYARLVTPDADGYFAEIVEFPGCFTTGETAPKALENLEAVAIDWINTAVEQGQDIPDPMDANEYSGKLVLRMTKGLHRRSALWAEREGVSLNQFITTCLAEAVGERARQTAFIPQPQMQAVANFTLQLLTLGSVHATAMPVHGYGGGTSQQLNIGSASTFIGVPMMAWQNPQIRDRRHG
jgi:predicted RNase H-like HicB family nuclease